MAKLVQKTITMPCDARFLHEGRILLDEVLSQAALPQREKDLLILAVDEAASSVVRYARYKGYRNDLTLTVDIDDVRFKATLVDSLNVFDLANGLNETQLAQKLAKEKGFTLGIFLIRRIMDEITYVYRKGFQNELEMIRFL